MKNSIIILLLTFFFLSGCVSPLTRAVIDGDINKVKALLDEGQDINYGDIGYPPLTQAAISENVEVVKLLIKRGSDVNLKTIYGESALHRASLNGNIIIAKLLLENGADPEICCSLYKDEETPLVIAKNRKHERLVRLLETYIKKEKIIYKGSGADSEEQVRRAYAINANVFSFKQNRNVNENSYALVIGINNYSENTNVDYADYSALAFEELANKTFGIPKENIITLLNDKASSGQLKAKIELVKELAEKGSNLYVYFAGHGVPGKDGATYLLPADMSADSIHLEPNLKLDSIYKNLSQSLASNIYVFMDSCFSGKDDSGKLLYKGVAPVLRANKVKFSSKKLTVFTAGKSTDFANDFKEKKHRLFSYFLLNELSQGNNNLESIYDSIRHKVKRNSLMKGVGYKQVPQLYGNVSHTLY